LEEHVKEILTDKLTALSPNQLKHLSLHSQLLAWVNSSCRSPSEAAVSNWTDDWKDGTALLDVVGKLAQPSTIIDSTQQFDDARQERIMRALNSVEKLFGILPSFEPTDLYVVTPTSIQSRRNATRHLNNEDIPLFIEMILSSSIIQHQSASIAEANRSVAWSGIQQNLKETAAPVMEKAEVLEQNLTAMADQALNQFAKPKNPSQNLNNADSSIVHDSSAITSQPDVDLLSVPSPTVTSHLSSTAQTIHPFAHVEQETGTARPTSATVSSTHISVPVVENNNIINQGTTNNLSSLQHKDEAREAENEKIKMKYPYAETQ